MIFCEIDKDQMYLIYYKEMFFVISLHLENFSIEKSKKVSSLHTHVPSIMILAYIMQNTMHKTIPKICTSCRVSTAKIYLYHSTKIAKARPHSVEWQTDSLSRSSGS